MAVSTINDHIRLFQMFQSNDLQGAKVLMEQYPNILKEVCEAGVHITYNPLYALISAPNTHDNKAMIDEILTKNPDLVNHVSFRANVLSYAVMNREDPELVQKLIDYGVNVNDQSKYDNMNWKIYKPTYNTPAHNAVMLNRPQNLEVLVKNHADLNIKNISTVTPMDIYLYNSHRLDSNIPKIIAKGGGDVSIQDNGASVPMGYAISKGSWTAVAEVLKHTHAILSNFQFQQISEAAYGKGQINMDATEALFYALDHLPKNYDFTAYAAIFGNTVDNKELYNDYIEHLTNAKMTSSTFHSECFNLDNDELVSCVDLHEAPTV